MLKETSKQELIGDLQRRVQDKILEPTNFELLKKLIEKADTLDEAIMIAELTRYGVILKDNGLEWDSESMENADVSN